MIILWKNPIGPKIFEVTLLCTCDGCMLWNSNFRKSLSFFRIGLNDIDTYYLMQSNNKFCKIRVSPWKMLTQNHLIFYGIFTWIRWGFVKVAWGKTSAKTLSQFPMCYLYFTRCHKHIRITVYSDFTSTVMYFNFICRDNERWLNLFGWTVQKKVPNHCPEPLSTLKEDAQ